MKDYKNYYNGEFSDYDNTDPNYIIANQKYPTSVDDENISNETTYSSKKIEELVSISGFKTVFVDELPEFGENNTIYFIPCDLSGVTDYYDEYMWNKNDSKWEIIGSTRIDMSIYYTKAETDEIVSNIVARIPVIDKTSNTGITFDIEPNKMYMFGDRTTLTINLLPGESGIVNEYMFQFTSGNVATTLNVPLTVTWLKEPDIQTNSIYQVSIENNLGIIGEWGNE